jgi:hypothetical protein
VFRWDRALPLVAAGASICRSRRRAAAGLALPWPTWAGACGRAGRPLAPLVALGRLAAGSARLAGGLLQGGRQRHPA